jgi:hypothetical protein
MGATAAPHDTALIRNTPVERRDANIALATGTSQFLMHGIESNRRKEGVILRDR